MTVIVIRTPEAELNPQNPFYEMQRSIPWLEDAVSAYRKHRSAPWVFTTKADLLKKRRENMEKALRRKREDDVTLRVPLYVWVFHVPGFIFGGWWMNIQGIREGWHHVSFEKNNPDLLERLMQLFPLVEPSLFDLRNWQEWKIKFAKHYQRGVRGGKPQGKAVIWADVKGGTIERIIKRAEWPRGDKQ